MVGHGALGARVAGPLRRALSRVRAVGGIDGSVLLKLGVEPLVQGTSSGLHELFERRRGPVDDGGRWEEQTRPIRRVLDI